MRSDKKAEDGTRHPEDSVRAKAMLLVLALVLALTPAACSGWSTDDQDPFADRPQTRFELVIYLAPNQTPKPLPWAGCTVPVRGFGRVDSLWPEPGVTATMSQGSQPAVSLTTDSSGSGMFADRTPGFHVLDLVTADRRLRGRLPLRLQGKTTRVFASVQPDSADLDGDGKRKEWVLQVEVIPDADFDLVSDNGLHAWWAFGTDGGVGLIHSGDARSERIVLDEIFNETSVEEFADRDGDFIPDSEDDDADGDGIFDDQETDSLACPGFRHEQLSAPGTRHAPLLCIHCHQEDDPVPLFCHDCHDLAGRAWAGNPGNTPADHFRRGCEHCHQADRGWAEVPGPGGADHRTYPLTGAHLRTDCFACHFTGNVSGLQTSCEGCHQNDAPPNHQTTACHTCHTTENWAPTASHDRFPLTGGHAGVACTKCHGAYTPGVGYQVPRPDRACATCHELPSGHIGIGGLACESCHTIDGWKPARGGHQGPLPDSVFDYKTWSSQWFPVWPTPHYDASECGTCHTRTGSGGDWPYYSCTTNCHGSRNRLDNRHNHGVDLGSDPSRRFSLYFYDPDDAGAPAAWPTAHVGCVHQDCHDDGALP
jgi:hypothetical protein